MAADIKYQIKEMLRGSEDVITSQDLERKLLIGRPLNVKFGVDPTAPDIHLGHTVPLQKLRVFQEFGHNVQLIIGDYTARIGDPSGRSDTRPMLSPEQIAANTATYTDQVFKVLDPNKTQVFFNNDWLGKFSATDIIKLGTKYSVQQLLQRRDFAARIANQKPLSVTELLYPLLVGYDSVHLKSDVELGGTDQLFNFMASREIQKAYGQSPEVVITLPLLEGVDGIKKMSKSLGNSIGVRDQPREMFGKIMSIPDNIMWRYYELLSTESTAKIEELKGEVGANSINPMDCKQRLAKELVGRYHGESAGQEAEAYFVAVVRQRNKQEYLTDLSIVLGAGQNMSLVELVRQTGRAGSNSEARRLIDQGAVRINGESVKDPFYKIDYSMEGVQLEVGRKYSGRLKLRNK